MFKQGLKQVREAKVDMGSDGLPVGKLYFGKGNAKLLKTATFSLPSGHSCPMAKACLSVSNRITGKITDGANNEFRCFTATSEAISKHLRKHVWRNWELLEACGDSDTMARLISRDLPNAALVRIHVGGDFYSKVYYEAWRKVAKDNPGHVDNTYEKPSAVGTIFYAYTKSLQYITDKSRSSNFIMTASRGGTMDNTIDKLGLKEARVVFTNEEADKLNYVIDHDDSNAWSHSDSFALILHGTQPKGSEAGEAMKVLKKAGWTGYSKGGKK